MVTPLKKILALGLWFALFNCAQASALTKVKVILDWYHNPNHASLIVAAEHGFFKKEGLEVELVGPSDPADPPKLAAAGAADIAVTYESVLITARSQGLPLKRIADLIPIPQNAILVRADSGITQIKQLKGRRVAYSNSGAANATLKKMLIQNGLFLDDVTLIDVHYNLLQPLLAGSVDAVIGISRNFEPYELQLHGVTPRLFLPEKHGVPTYSALILVARDKFAGTPACQKFLRALSLSTQYLKKHPDESWREFIKAYPHLNDLLNHHAYLATVPLFADDPRLCHIKEYEQYAKFLNEYMLIEKIPKSKSYMLCPGQFAKDEDRDQDEEEPA